MKNMTLVELADATASNKPVPGGGSIAAVCGTLSAALAEMVANLTIGKKKYGEVEGEMLMVSEKANSLRKSLIEDIQKDSDAFSLVMEAFKLPKETEEEKEIRQITIQNNMKIAAETPLEVARKAYSIMSLSEMVVAHGNSNAITDGLVSLMLARTAVLSALLNVKINLDSIKDEDFVQVLAAEVVVLEAECQAKEVEVLRKYGL
jgi:formiminotetrahydrofolate cyclodeaminase